MKKLTKEEIALMPMGYTRDAMGNTLTCKDSSGNWDEYTRDALGNELTFKDSSGVWTKIAESNYTLYVDGYKVWAGCQRFDSIEEALKHWNRDDERAKIFYEGFEGIPGEFRIMPKLHKDGTTPSGQEIFVFGSNLAGIHGAGAAKEAVRFGAKWGFSTGQHGNSYGIPTKDANINSLPLEDAELYIQNFVNYTKMNSDKQFFVTRVGCGLAGFSDEQIAPLFADAQNCSFAEEWEPYVK
jgi:hypothetical protein